MLEHSKNTNNNNMGNIPSAETEKKLGLVIFAGHGNLSHKRNNMFMGMIVSKRKDALRRINIVRNFI